MLYSPFEIKSTPLSVIDPMKMRISITIFHFQLWYVDARSSGIEIEIELQVICSFFSGCSINNIELYYTKWTFPLCSAVAKVFQSQSLGTPPLSTCSLIFSTASSQLKSHWSCEQVARGITCLINVFCLSVDLLHVSTCLFFHCCSVCCSFHLNALTTRQSTRQSTLDIIWVIPAVIWSLPVLL
jgi:hypothetical protein